MSAATPLVQAQNLYRDYGRLRAVADLDLSLERGQVLGLLGPNGAGKTSTLHMICGVLAPTAGRIHIDGYDLFDEPRRAKRALGYLPEIPPLYRDSSVDEYLSFCAALHGVRTHQRGPLCRRALELCGLGGVRRRLIGNLSKGFQQRVGIAQAILHEPAVIVLDEPTVGLDPIQIRQIRDLISTLGQDHGVILSTHVLVEVQAVCSHVQILHQGRTVYRDALDATDGVLCAGALRLRLRATVSYEAVVGLDGVRQAESLGAGRWRLQLEPGTAPEAVAHAVVEHGWGLQELMPERRSLEQIFVQATTGDPPIDAGGATA